MSKIKNKLIRRMVSNILKEAKFNKMPPRDLVEVLAYLSWIEEHWSGFHNNKEEQEKGKEKFGTNVKTNTNRWSSEDGSFDFKSADWMTPAQKDLISSFDFRYASWGGEAKFKEKAYSPKYQEGPISGQAHGNQMLWKQQSYDKYFSQGHSFNKIGPGWFIVNGKVEEWIKPMIEEFVTHFYQQNKQALKSPHKASSYDDPKRGKDTLDNRMAKTLRGQTLSKKGGRKSSKERFRVDKFETRQGKPVKRRITLQAKIIDESRKWVQFVDSIDFDSIQENFERETGLKSKEFGTQGAGTGKTTLFLKNAKGKIKRELQMGYRMAVVWYLEGEMVRVIRGYQDLFSKMFADKSEKEQAKYLQDIMLSSGDSDDLRMGRELATSMGKGSTYATEPMGKFEDLEERKMRVTKKQLKKVIREEFSSFYLNEAKKKNLIIENQVRKLVRIEIKNQIMKGGSINEGFLSNMFKKIKGKLGFDKEEKQEYQHISVKVKDAIAKGDYATAEKLINSEVEEGISSMDDSAQGKKNIRDLKIAQKHALATLYAKPGALSAKDAALSGSEARHGAVKIIFGLIPVMAAAIEERQKSVEKESMKDSGW